ncbi:hypothetical protein ASG25_13960 [Rhizobium sp. Leaf384]|nr:hypothetical protein ASG03_18780 [Rhizobium sp. Leaf341]KQS77688.1 hypothetical protein ASG25_13960 [Rhizobium sp. Leaf384]KQS84534.1 hypothetical protein ASG58_20580 [Rhizobium sp. Leaf383]
MRQAMQKTIEDVAMPRFHRTDAGKQTRTAWPTLRIIALICAFAISVGFWVGAYLLLRLIW